MCENVLFNGSCISRKKVCRPTIWLSYFLARYDHEHDPARKRRAGLLQMLECLLRLDDRRRAAPPQEKNGLLNAANDVLMLVDDLHAAQVTKFFAARKAICQLRFEACSPRLLFVTCLTSYVSRVR